VNDYGQLQAIVIRNDRRLQLYMHNAASEPEHVLIARRQLKISMSAKARLDGLEKLWCNKSRRSRRFLSLRSRSDFRE